MKAISVQQPWAWAIAAGVKPVENRTRMQGWRSAAGTTVLLHAGKRFAERGATFSELVDAYHDRTGLTPPLRDDHPFVYGALLATVEVVDVHYARGSRCCEQWGEAPYYDGTQWVATVHLALANPQPLSEPVPWRGQLGLFTVPDETIAARQR